MSREQGLVADRLERADQAALATAATLLHARRLRDAAGEDAVPPPYQSSRPALADHGIPATGERAHLVRVAGCLDHPAVAAALDRLAFSTGEHAVNSAELAGEGRHSDR